MHNNFIILKAILKTLMKRENQDKNFNFLICFQVSMKVITLPHPMKTAARLSARYSMLSSDSGRKSFFHFIGNRLSIFLSRAPFSRPARLSQKPLFFCALTFAFRDQNWKFPLHSFVNLLSHLWLNVCIFAAHKVGQHETCKKVFLSIVCREMLIWKLNSYLNNSP